MCLLASTARPEKTISFAKPSPTMRGRRWLPPQPGDDPEVDLRLAELCLPRRYADVAGESELAAAAERDSR